MAALEVSSCAFRARSELTVGNAGFEALSNQKNLPAPCGGSAVTQPQCFHD
jgi:hypothetical protein